MRDRLIELLSVTHTETDNYKEQARLHDEYIADHLLANGVVLLDFAVVTPENRPLITQIANMPLNDVCELIKAKQEGRIITPPCKVGDIVWGILGDTVCQWKVFFRTYSDDEGWWVFLGWNGEDRHARIFGDCFHKKYFPTKEEAEEKLKELQKNG